jgi:hypothetical protein
VRVMQLTHNRRNLVGDGCMEPSAAGLSRFGYEVVAQLNAAKIVVDLAHGSPRTIHDGIAASKAPMMISHTGRRAPGRVRSWDWPRFCAMVTPRLGVEACGTRADRRRSNPTCPGFCKSQYLR